MKKTIWKYQLRPVTRQVVDMPEGAQILTMQLQHDVPTLWAEVDPEALLVERDFEIVGTGNGVPPEPHAYLGTWQNRIGLVFHVFEVMAK